MKKNFAMRSVYVSTSAHEKLKVAAFKERITMSELLSRLIEETL